MLSGGKLTSGCLGGEKNKAVAHYADGPVPCVQVPRIRMSMSLGKNQFDAAGFGGIVSNPARRSSISTFLCHGNRVCLLCCFAVALKYRYTGTPARTLAIASEDSAGRWENDNAKTLVPAAR